MGTEFNVLMCAEIKNIQIEFEPHSSKPFSVVKITAIVRSKNWYKDYELGKISEISFEAPLFDHHINALKQVFDDLLGMAVPQRMENKNIYQIMKQLELEWEKTQFKQKT